MIDLEIVKQSPKELRKFGLTMAAMALLMFGIVIPWLFDKDILNLWVLVICSVFIFFSLLVPQALQPVYYYWMKFALVIGKFNTMVILGIVFYLLFTPIALIMRIIKRDVLERSFDESLNTYRHNMATRPPDHMEKPF